MQHVPEPLVDVIDCFQRIDARVVDPDIDTAVALDGRVCQALDFAWTADIGGLERHRETGLDQFIAAVRCQTADQYVGAGLGQALTDGKADAAAASGDHGGFAG
ncbi:hypothetical protein D3C86_1538750 [compost metagenome]